MCYKRSIFQNKYGILKWTKERKFLFMKNYTKKNLKASKGITLIALVITIIKKEDTKELY